jgi:tRNA (adenine37-N6)-methyltransferase
VPRAAEGVRGTIELHPGHNFEDALSDLAGFEYIWVLFWFHLNAGWRPKVLPPRSEIKRGMFATRTPYRPNPIGMSALRLEGIEGLTLHVSDLDLLDGTPVLDIKPYIAWTDAIPEARPGWLDGNERVSHGDRPEDPKPDYTVTVSTLAAEQLQFLRDHGVELEASARQILALGPQPHAYRRIKHHERGSTLAVHDWRVHFQTLDRTIEVVSVSSGYRAEQLPDHPLHRAFVAKYS